MTTRPRIALFSSVAPGIGGVERNMLQLIEGLSSRFEFQVIAPDFEPAFRRALERMPSAVQMYALERPSKLTIRDLPGILSALRRMRPHIVHTQNPRDRYFSFPLARMLGIRTVNTFNMSPLIYGNSRIRQRLFVTLEKLYAHRLTSGAAFVSTHLRDLYDRYGVRWNTPNVLIHNGLDLPPLAALRPQRDEHRKVLHSILAIPEDVTVVLAVGRLHRQKGFDYLMEALPLLVDFSTVNPFHVALVGDGVERQRLSEQARALHVEHLITFLGWREEEEVHRIMTGSDVLAFPSRLECFPYTLLEATGAGLPTVASDVGGNPEIILHERNGWIVPPGDPAALASALAHLINAPAIREKFRHHAIEDASRFSVGTMVDQTGALYDEILRT